jgi:hypothetical protein
MLSVVVDGCQDKIKKYKIKIATKTPRHQITPRLEIQTKQQVW